MKTSDIFWECNIELLLYIYILSKSKCYKIQQIRTLHVKQYISSYKSMKIVFACFSLQSSLPTMYVSRYKLPKLANMLQHFGWEEI